MDIVGNISIQNYDDIDRLHTDTDKSFILNMQVLVYVILFLFQFHGIHAIPFFTLFSNVSFSDF